jgi:polyphosphate kinase
MEIGAAKPIDLRDTSLYLNRELSLLQFNRRVLEQARDHSVPLLERLRFLCISSTNLDEFFEIRVSGAKQRQAAGAGAAGPDGLSAQDILSAVSRDAHELVATQYQVMNDELFPALAEVGIHFIRRRNWDAKQQRWLKRYFRDALLPVLSPIGLDPAHPFPRILNKSLNFIVKLKGKDAFGRNSGMAVVQAPRALPRIIELPPDISGPGQHFVFLSSVIHAFVDDLFPGMSAADCYQFRVTRNQDLFVDEEEVDDLLRALEGELPSRRYGEAVRLEVADQCPDEEIEFLREQFRLNDDDVYRVDGPVNLNRLIQVVELVDTPDLKYTNFTPGIPTRVSRAGGLFESIARDDILLHHPFESFLPVVDLLRQAASDPNVVAIKQTLYRTGPDSAIVDALVSAADAGKEVTVVIELRARYDEAENIALANRLQDAGVHVVYGVVGYKAHAKLMLIVRREGRKLRRYAHLGTGNYHPRTSRLYTDYGLMSCDKALTEDVHKVFMQLTSLGRGSKLARCLQSPFSLASATLDKIDREGENAKAGKPARIIAKVNALTDPQVIEALYRASGAGVRVELIVRGICVLRPGIPGVSDNIRVVSIVGRFLEHTRVFYFQNDDDPEVYLSSADWMERNLYRRVEVAFPLEHKRLKDRVSKDLRAYLRDNVQAWDLTSDGDYIRCSVGAKSQPFSAQDELLERLGDA